MQISNGLGSIAGFVQLVVWFFIRFTTTPKDKDLPGKPTNEVQLSNVA